MATCECAGRYLGGAGVKISRLWLGSGLGLGLGAFFTSFLPLSLFPMRESMTQTGTQGKSKKWFAERRQINVLRGREG